MKLKDFKRLNENWSKWKLTEGKLQYSVSNTGYGDVYEFFDETGEETEQTLGMMVLDLADAGVGGWAPEEQIDRMMAVNADPSKNQGGMQKWDSSVFEDYYGADNQKILQAWAKMSGMELEQMPEAEGEYEDDGTNDFEEYYSESKKRNKVHESRMGDLHIQIQDALSEIMQQYGVGLEDIEGVIGDMKSDQGAGGMLQEAGSPQLSLPKELVFEIIEYLQDMSGLKLKGSDFIARRAKELLAKMDTGDTGPEHSLEERIKQIVARRLKERKQR